MMIITDLLIITPLCVQQSSVIYKYSLVKDMLAMETNIIMMCALQSTRSVKWGSISSNNAWFMCDHPPPPPPPSISQSGWRSKAWASPAHPDPYQSLTQTMAEDKGRPTLP